MIRRPSWLTIGCLTAVGILHAAMVAAAAEPPRPAIPAPDWKKLDGLLQAGAYKDAATLADEIATNVKPKRRDPDFVTATIDHVLALSRRGFAELRLGRLDDADATLEDAYRAFRDRDFQRLLSLETRQPTVQVMNKLVLLELNWVELLNLRMGVILERLRFATLAKTAASEAELREQARAWLKDLAVLERLAAEARESLVTRFDKGGDAVLASPRFRSLVGDFWPEMVAGIRSLELSRLPFGDPGQAGDDAVRNKPVLDKPALVNDAGERFVAAEAALEKAIAAAAPKGASGLRPEGRTEANLLRAELLTNEGYALLITGQPARAREKIAKAIDLHKDAVTQRGLQRPESHPSLFWPRLLAAEAMLEESRLALAGGDATAAKATTRAAVDMLAAADDSTFPKTHPLHARLATLQARLNRELATAEATIPGTDAADAAARSLRRAIDATAAAGAAF